MEDKTMKNMKRFMVGAAAFLLFLVFGSMSAMAQAMPTDPFAMLNLAGPIALMSQAVGIIISILIAVFMYKDAEKRGKSGIVWAIIGFFCTCIGLVIWLLVRPPLQQGPAGYGAPPPGYQQPPPGYQQPPPGYQQPPPGYQPPPGPPPQ